MKNITGIPGKLLILQFALILLFLEGCSVWTNFTTYFNLYYNAKNKFETTEKEILKEKKDLFTLQESKPAGTVSQSLTSVIEKLSRLLQFKSESAYVDDALLMIGKSFYFQQDYQKALRKFTELVSTSPESDLVLETNYWVGKTYFRLKSFDEGNKIFEEVKKIALEEDENELLSKAYIEQISYLISIENYSQAIENIVKLIEVSDDEQKNAVIMLELGKLYLEIEQPENAAKAFADVLEFSPDYETEFKARLEYGKVQRQLNNSEKALAIFEDIKSESNFNEFLDQTELELGLTQRKLEQIDEAFKQLTFVDTTYRQTPSSGAASYNLGEILEYSYSDYDSAFGYYQKASTSTAKPEILELAKKKVAVLTKYATLHKTINDYKKQLSYLEEPDKFIQDSIAYVIEQARIDSLNEEKLSLNVELTENTAGRRATERNPRPLEKRGEKPIQNATKKIPPVRPNLSADSIKSILVKNEYDLGGLFFTELHLPDSAYYFYSHILSEYPKSSYNARTLYALGSYYLTMNEKLKADSLFEIVYENYQSESIVNAAANQLNKPLINLEYDPAEELYLSAEAKMKAGEDSIALTELVFISNKYPESQYAPKAMFATGWILENKLKMLDSAAVVYDSVLSQYPSSSYAKAVQQKVKIYNDEQKRIQAIADSGKVKLDSIQTGSKIDSVALLDSNKINDTNVKDNVSEENNSETSESDPLEIEEPIPVVPPPINSTEIDSTINKNQNNDGLEKDTTRTKRTRPRR